MNVTKFYSSILYFYPEDYRKKYGGEILMVFSEMYKDEKNQGKAGLFFWSRIILDVALSGVGQHLDNLGERGVKSYLKDTLYINRFNTAGFFLLLPVSIMAVLDLTIVLIIGSRVELQSLYGSFFYEYPILVTWVLILPTLAIVLNLISLLLAVSVKKVEVLSVQFIKLNFFSLLILGVGTLYALVLFGHDTIGCLGNHILKEGLNNLLAIISYCRQA